MTEKPSDKQQPKYRDFAGALKRLTPEERAKVKAELEARELAQVTNSKGEVVPTVFPSND